MSYLLSWALGVMVMVGRNTANEETSVPPSPLQATVAPAGVGRQMVRFSLPLSPGTLLQGQTLKARALDQDILTCVRPLTWYPKTGDEPASARRALITFPFTFPDKSDVTFTFESVPQPSAGQRKFPAKVEVQGDQVIIAYRKGPTLHANLIAPNRTSEEPGITETVEANDFFLWERVRIPDPVWPRVIEIRQECLGTVAIIGHVQNMNEGYGRAPNLGWEISGEASEAVKSERGLETQIEKDTVTHSFQSGIPCLLSLNEGRWTISHPQAAMKRRGGVEAWLDEDKLSYRYTRCLATDKVPMQQASWRKAEVVIAPGSMAPLTQTLAYPHPFRVDTRIWDQVYATGEPLDVHAFPECEEILRVHHEAIIRSARLGDDWGNITSFSDALPSGDVFGMNRLNHCPPIFEEAWRTGDQRLLEAAVLWCDNFYDLSVWWGPKETGGTRYNNIVAMNEKPPDGDTSYMWRSNSSVNFCTKGYDSFLLAYEETGDPRMLEAFKAQVAYASQSVHALQECRNVGDVRDFVRIYRATGEKEPLEQALRLFSEVRSKLSTGDLFSQSGDPLEANPPYIEEDAFGYKHPFAKPYIIGYALAGLPELGPIRPEEPKLRDVVKAVADFLAESQDPLGGWRYPHPRSSTLIASQAIEHAWQIMQADLWLGPDEKHLDAIERVLRQRIWGWKRTGRFLYGLTGWEMETGKVKSSSELYDLYKAPSDRDGDRDYAEGKVVWGSCPPEGLVYLPDVLRYYLQHRGPERLLAEPTAEEPLGQVLARVNRN